MSSLDFGGTVPLSRLRRFSVPMLLTGRITLQVLNFAGYEIWEIEFPDRTGEYSNYAK
jgi:hypothetical protein